VNLKGKRNNGLTQQALVIYVIMAFVLGCTAYYYLMYMPEKKEVLISKGVRTVNNISHGIIGKEKYYEDILIQKYFGNKLANDSGAQTDEKEVYKFHLDHSLKIVNRDSLPKSYKSRGRGNSLSLSHPGADHNLFLFKLLTAEDIAFADTVKVVIEFDTIVGKVNLADFMRGQTDNEMFSCVVIHTASRKAETPESKILYSNNPGLLSTRQKYPTKVSIDADSLLGVRISPVMLNELKYMEFKTRAYIGDEEVYISGLINMKEYNNAIREINYWLLVFLLLFTLTLISAIPAIKIVSVNEWERLQDRDAILASFGFICMCFFLLMLVATTVNYFSEDKKIKKQLERVVAVHSDSLQQSMKEYLRVLNSPFDTSEASNVLFHEYFKTTEKDSESEYFDEIFFPYKNQKVFGDKDYLTKLFNEYTPIHKRNYIRKLRNDNGFVFQDTVSGTNLSGEFYLESVYSYVRGEREAVLSRKDKDSVAINCISFDLKDLMWDEPDEGYGIALIDRDLNVLFGSKKTRNNFTNLERDIHGGEFIRNAVRFNKTETGHFNYGKDRFKARVVPVQFVTTNGGENSALFLVAFGNQKLVEWKSGVTSTLSGILFLQVPLMMLVVLALYLMLRTIKRPGKFFSKTHQFEYLFPGKKESKGYVFIFLVALLSIIFLLVFQYKGMNFVSRFTITQVVLFATVRVLLTSRPNKSSSYRKRVRWLLLALMGLIVLICTVPNSEDDYGLFFCRITLPLLVFSGVMIAAAILAKILKKRFNGELTEPARKNIDYESHQKNVQSAEFQLRNLYTASMFSWLMAIMVVPFVCIFMITSSRVNSSFDQLACTVKTEKREARKDDLKQRYQKYESKGLIEDYFSPANKQQGTDQNCKKDSTATHDTTVTMVSTAPFYQWVTGLFGSRYKWYPNYSASNQSKISDVKNENSFLSTCLLYAVAIVFLLFLYLATRLMLIKLFFNVPAVLKKGCVCRKNITTEISSHFDKDKNKVTRLMLVGLPYSQRFTFLKELKYSKEKIFTIDFKANADYLNKPFSPSTWPPEFFSAEVIVVRHWFPRIADLEHLQYLRILNQLLNDNRIKKKAFVLFAHSTLTQLEREWYDSLVSNGNQSISHEFLFQLKDLLGRFREFVIPINQDAFEDKVDSKRIMCEEKFEEYFSKSYYSPAFYSIWNALTLKERFLLYDLADDSMVNLTDRATWFKLRLKGLISYEANTYRLQFFKESFGLFLREGVSNKELIEMERLTKQHGTWGQVRLALILLVLSLLFFIYTLNPSFLNTVAGAVGVLATIAGGLSQLKNNVNLPKLRLFRKK